MNTTVFDKFIENEIFINTIDVVFRNMNIVDKTILQKYYRNLLIVIYYAFFADNSDFNIYKKKLTQNNYSDAKSILLLLLPYLNTSENIGEITSFDDIIKKKKKEVDINLESPKYIYTNLQYGRCIRDKENKNIKEIDFSEDIIKHNYIFLVNTIKTTSHKLYINWIDTVPYNLIDYQNSNLFKNTYELFMQGELRDYTVTEYLNEHLLKRLQALDIADVYETFTNELYSGIKKIKWLIYDIYLDNLHKPFPLIIILNQYFNSIFGRNIGNDWSSVSQDIKDVFTFNWNNIINLADSNKGHTIGTITLSSSNIRRILKVIVLFFNNYYKDIENLVEKGEYEKIDKYAIIDEELDNADDNEMDTIRYSVIRRALNKIKLEDIYNFICDSIELMKLTWYSLKLMNKDKYKILTLTEYSKVMPYTQTNKITIKNIYNFAKSLCHVEYNGKYTMLPKFWNSLTTNSRTVIHMRLFEVINVNILKSWFNITRNINKYNKITDIDQYHTDIFNYVMSHAIEIVFESMISRGILSKLEPNLVITDTANIPTDKRQNEYPGLLKETVFSTDDTNNIWTSSYYYLTSTTYKSMNPLVLNTGDENTKKFINYFDWNASTHSRAWYSAYALHWISQINFFNKFLNNRVIYVTGATGVGKSTQVPKLLLYAQKAILYNSISSIVCTQPRKTPTLKNAQIVSLELGVPISTEAKNNYYIQYKYKNAKHIKHSHHLNLKFVTDGTLSVEITNPLLKKEPFYANNLYDIVIVDEAHEHNANMDMILTFMKYATQYNNTIKLVIISATMDDDEPIYRRFYRDINDNQMFPLSQNIKSRNLDRINVDRRFDISPPGQTTRYKIDEYYLEDLDNNLHNPINLTLNLINTTSKGDILIFQPGVGEIEKLVETLNKFLPSDVIALPYHSLLKTRQRNFIEDIATKLPFLRITKDTNFSEIDDPEQGNNTVNYKRVVIVATNIAEASITISTLKYVIETGTQKTAIYDYKKHSDRLQLTTISESSRLQRKGRVGRVSPGTVYYLYNKGKTEDIKTIYNICIQDISFDLYKRLFTNSNEKILLDRKNDPGIININYNNLKTIYHKFHKSFESYFVLDTYYNYVGNKNHYDYDNYENILLYHEDGYSMYNLNDYDGKFYIIHPEEIYIKRNITGTIISNNNPSNKLINNKLESDKLRAFWEILKNDHLLDYNGKIVKKIDIGIKIQKLQEIFEFDNPKAFRTFLYSFVFDVKEDIIRLLCLLDNLPKYTDNLITGYYLNNHYIKPLEKIKNIVGNNCQGDLEIINNILKLYHNKLDNLNIKYNNDFDYNSNIYMEEASKIIINETEKMKEYFMSIFSVNSSKMLGKFDYMDRNDYLKFRNTESFTDMIQSSYNNKYNEIYNFLLKMNINDKLLQKYFTTYNDIKNKLYLYMNKALDNVKPKEYKYLDEVVHYFKKNILRATFTNTYDKLLSCFLMANPYNIVIKISSKNQYLYLSDPTSENIYNIKSVSKNSTILDTLMDQKYNEKYLYFHKMDVDNDSISLVNNIPIYLFENLYSIYNITNIKANKYLTHEVNNKIYSHQYINTLTDIEKDIKYTNKITDTNIRKNINIDTQKIELFNRKIKEIMS